MHTEIVSQSYPTADNTLVGAAPAAQSAPVAGTATDDLADLLVDESVARDGVWMRPDPDRALRIRTRGLPDAYYDAQTRQQRTAAKGFNNDANRLPVSTKRMINARCLVQHSLVDVEHCIIGGRALSFSEFCELLLEPRGSRLLDLAFTAATMAQEAKADDLQAAQGN